MTPYTPVNVLLELSGTIVLLFLCYHLAQWLAGKITKYEERRAYHQACHDSLDMYLKSIGCDCEQRDEVKDRIS